MAEYIEREAAFNALLKLIPKVDDDGYCWVIRGDAATAIDSIPAANVRPVVHGKWIWQDAPCFGNPYGSYKCECGCLMPHKTNFCPNCGAMMEES